MAACSALTELHPLPPPEALRKKNLTDETVGRVALHMMEAITRNFRERQGSASSSPTTEFRGVWHPNGLAAHLVSLGDRVVTWNGRQHPASKVHNSLRKRFVFQKPRAPSETWESVVDTSFPGGCSPYEIRVKKGVLPAAAFRDLADPKHLILLDCAQTSLLSYALAILEILGDAQFNKYIAIFGPETTFSSKCAPPYIATLCSPSYTKKPRLGQQMYVENILEYGYKTPHGGFHGMSLLYAGEGRSIGLDVSNSRGATLEECLHTLHAAFNSKPLPFEEMFPDGSAPHTIPVEINGTTHGFSFTEIKQYAKGENAERFFETTADPLDAWQDFFRDECLPNVVETEQQMEELANTTFTYTEFLKKQQSLPPPPPLHYLSAKKIQCILP